MHNERLPAEHDFFLNFEGDMTRVSEDCTSGNVDKTM
jgi:hypothetical protein